MWLVVVPDSHVRLGEIPEWRLGVDDRIVEAAEVRRSRDLLVARIALTLCDGSVGGVGVSAPVVQVREIEAMVGKQRAVAPYGRDLVGVDWNDGVVDGGAAAIHAAHEPE